MTLEDVGPDNRVTRKDFIMTDQPSGPSVSAVRDAALLDFVGRLRPGSPSPLYWSDDDGMSRDGNDVLGGSEAPAN